MAAQTAVRRQHATLSTTVVDTVTLSGRCRSVVVTNRDGTNTVYATVGVGSAPADPVAAADETIVVPVNARKVVWADPYGRAKRGLVVKILGNGGAYDVEGEEHVATG